LTWADVATPLTQLPLVEAPSSLSSKVICPPVETSRKVTPMTSVQVASAARASVCPGAVSPVRLTVIVPPVVTLKRCASPGPQ